MKRPTSSSSSAAPPQTYSVASAAGPDQFVQAGRMPCPAMPGKPGKVRRFRLFHHGAGSVDGPREQMVVIGIDSGQARRAGTAAIVVSPAPEQPVIWTALIGVYRRPASGGSANEFVIPRGTHGITSRSRAPAGLAFPNSGRAVRSEGRARATGGE